MSVEKEFIRQQMSEWIAKSLLKRIEELEAALYPFTDVVTEGCEDYPDDHKCAVQAGRVTHYALTMGDFRRAASVAAKPTTGE